MQFFLTPDVIFVVYDHFMCKVFLEGRRVEELRQKVAAEAGIFLINFDVHVLPALYTKLCIPSDLNMNLIFWHPQCIVVAAKYYIMVYIMDYFFHFSLF